MNFDENIAAFISEVEPTGIASINSLPTTCTKYEEDAINHCIQKLNGRCLLVIDPKVDNILIGCVLGKHYGPNCLYIVPQSKIDVWANHNISKATHKFTNQAVISFDNAKNHEAILAHHWDCVIIDHFEMLLCENSNRSQKLIPFLKTVPAIILFSRTPIEARSAILFPYLNILYPFIFKNKDEYLARYGLGKYDMKDITFDKVWYDKLYELHRIFAKISLVITDKVLNLKPIKRFQISLKPNADQLAILASLKKTKKELRNTVPINRQREKKHFKLTWETHGIIKSNLCKDIIMEISKLHPDEKIVIVAYHEQVISILSNIVDKIEIIQRPQEDDIKLMGVSVLIFLEKDTTNLFDLDVIEKKVQSDKYAINSYEILLDHK